MLGPKSWNPILIHEIRGGLVMVSESNDLFVYKLSENFGVWSLIESSKFAKGEQNGCLHQYENEKTCVLPVFGPKTPVYINSSRSRLPFARDFKSSLEEPASEAYFLFNSNKKIVRVLKFLKAKVSKSSIPRVYLIKPNVYLCTFISSFSD